jgi:hypothetical protein
MKCVALKSFFIPKVVHVIDASAFNESGIESLIIDEQNEYFAFDQGLLLSHPRTHLIRSFSFSECISIPSTVETLERFCFHGNKFLVTIQIPNKIEVIPPGSFSNCSKLFNFSFESGSRLHRIDDGAFFYCSSLNHIIVPAWVEFFADMCFGYCTSLTVITFEPDSRLKEIGTHAFYHCPALRTFELPQFVDAILSRAFGYCKQLSEFFIPFNSRLQRIEGKSFEACSALTYFRIPASVKFIGPEAFPESCTFEVEGGNQANAVREWCVRFLLNPKSTLDLSSLSDSSEWHFEFDRFREVGRIGSGAQGEVRRYQDRTTGEFIAVKSVSLLKYDINDQAVQDRVFREVQSLMKFRHPSIVPLLGYDLQLDSKLLLIAMPYIGSDSLESVLKSARNHPWFTLTAKTIIIVGIVI